MVKNLPANAGDLGLIPGGGTKISHAARQLSPQATTTELVRLNERAHVPQTTEPMRPGTHAPQLKRENPHATTREKPVRHKKEPTHRTEKIPHASTQIPSAATKTRRSKKKERKKINK